MDSVFGNRMVVISALVGSHNYNLNNASSDEDRKYFVMPTFDDLYTGTRFSTAKQTDTFDYDCHDIRSLAELIWKSNINFIEVLFSRNYVCVPEMKWIFYNADELATMNLPYLFNATFGMHLQKMKELHKGTAKTDVLIERYGYDTKQACHALRCLYILENIYVGQPMRHAIWYKTGSHQHTGLMNLKNSLITEEDFLETVENWKAKNLEDIRSWFLSQPAKPEFKDKLDLKIKNFIRERLE